MSNVTELLDRGRSLVRTLLTPQQENYVVGMLSDPDDALDAVKDLREAGFPNEDIVLQSQGEVAARVLLGNHGDRVREFVVEEGSICADYNERALGYLLLSVYTRTPQAVTRAATVLSSHDAREIKYFGDWTIRDLA